MKYLILIILLTTLSFSQNNIDSLESVIKLDETNIDVKFKLAMIYHDQIRDETGDEDERAEELFLSILKQKRNHVEARVYYGSLLTLKGRDAFLPWKKLSYVEEGCDEMDKAVKIAPENITVRLTRAINNIHLPGFFNRLTYCLEDFNFLRKNSAFESFNNSMKQQILYYNAKALMNNDEAEKAVELYESVVAIDATSSLGKKANSVISE